MPSPYPPRTAGGPEHLHENAGEGISGVVDDARVNRPGPPKPLVELAPGESEAWCLERRDLRHVLQQARRVRGVGGGVYHYVAEEGGAPRAEIREEPALVDLNGAAVGTARRHCAPWR